MEAPPSIIGIRMTHSPQSVPVEDSDLSIILPALDEEESLRTLLPELNQRFPRAEILVVDDGSHDGTADIAREFGCRVISHPYRKGNGAAVKTGIRAATRKYIVLLDADGQHDPAEIPSLIRHLDRYDLVVGARLADRTSPAHRKLANRFYNTFATYLTQIPILDLTSGFRALPRKLALRFCYLLPNTYSYPTTLTLSMVRAGYSVRFEPIAVRSRIGKSKVKIVRDGVRFLLIMLKVIMLFAPLRVFLPISVACFLIGIVYGGTILITAHHFTPATLLLLITSLLTFLMGLIGEQIAQLRLSHIDFEEADPVPERRPD